MGKPGLFAALGVPRVVNAAGHLSRLGGSTPSVRVCAATADAARSYVDLGELRAAVGARLAQLTRNEAADVCAGAAAGVVTALLACIRSRELMGPARARVVVHRVHRVPPDRTMDLLPIEIIEVGTVFGTDEDDLCRALDGAAALLYAPNVGPAGAAVALPDAIGMARAAGADVVLDCAAELPPASNLWHFTTELGADIAVFSGGKDLGAHADTGLILGRADLIDHCRALGTPNTSVLRAMKVGKEQLASVLAATEEYLSIDQDARVARAHRIHQAWADDWIRWRGIQVLPGGPFGDDPYWIHVSWPQPGGSEPTSMGAAELAAGLWDGNPRIAVQLTGGTLRLTAFTLTDDDAGVVQQRVGAALARAVTRDGTS